MRMRLAVGLGMLVGLWACDTVHLGSPPADVNACRPSQQFFYERVWPEFLAKDYGGKHCNDSGCHDASAIRSLVLPTPTSMPALPLPSDWAAVYRSATEHLFCTNAEASPLVARPSRDDHGGHKLIDPTGPETALVKMWVSMP